ncbi:MAG: hypothetical protein IKI29_02155 [Clostridia bacterium]|nr:hypothetical protein [Clostridia bacterium]
MNFRYRLMQFMRGRYGVDALFYGIFIVACLGAMVNLFLRLRVLQWIVYLLVLLGFLRIFSRNIEQRRAENRWFTKLIEPFRKKTEQVARQRADRYHVYRKCRHCKAILRLPRRIGKHKTVCPKCGQEMTVRVRR